MDPPQQPIAVSTDDRSTSVDASVPAISPISSSQISFVPKPEPPIEKTVLTEQSAPNCLGFAWPERSKWLILTVIFVVQVSMNFNASIYANDIVHITERFDVSAQAARVGQCVFLIAYAFGCELWAPWSEEIGRWPILQTSLLFVNIWQIPAALAPNFATLVVARFLGGLSSAGGSVTLGIVADMWRPDQQQFAVGYIVFSSVSGSVVGPIVGGLMQQYLDYSWNFWIQLMLGVVTQALHFFFVPETRASVLLDREAQAQRKSGDAEKSHIYGPNEVQGPFWKRMTLAKCMTIWARPFIMFVREPIVLLLSLLSGFSDALIFTFLEAFQPVYKQYGFGPSILGLSFVPLLVGYIIAYASYFPFFYRDQGYAARNGGRELPLERRLLWLLFTAPLEVIGLFGFAWTSMGPSRGIPWIAPMIFSSFVGIANFSIYQGTVSYMVAAYGPYASSATGGNGFARDFLAGVAAMYSAPFYDYFKTNTLELPSTILGCVALCVTIPIYVFYWKGPQIRAASPFAQTLASEVVPTRTEPASLPPWHASQRRTAFPVPGISDDEAISPRRRTTQGVNPETTANPGHADDGFVVAPQDFSNRDVQDVESAAAIRQVHW